MNSGLNNSRSVCHCVGESLRGQIKTAIVQKWGPIWPFLCLGLILGPLGYGSMPRRSFLRMVIRVSKNETA